MSSLTAAGSLKFSVYLNGVPGRVAVGVVLLEEGVIEDEASTDSALLFFSIRKGSSEGLNLASSPKSAGVREYLFLGCIIGCFFCPRGWVRVGGVACSDISLQALLGAWLSDKVQK